jgi:hypothetical protein
MRDQSAVRPDVKVHYRHVGCLTLYISPDDIRKAVGFCDTLDLRFFFQQSLDCLTGHIGIVSQK